MEKTRISDKFQVVIPKTVRQKLGLREGQELNAYALKDGVLLTPKTRRRWPDDYIGSERDIWNSINLDEYLEEERNSWA